MSRGRGAVIPEGAGVVGGHIAQTIAEAGVGDAVLTFCTTCAAGGIAPPGWRR